MKICLNLAKPFYFSVDLILRPVKALCDVIYGANYFSEDLKNMVSYSHAFLLHTVLLCFIFSCSKVWYKLFWNACGSMISGGTQKRGFPNVGLWSSPSTCPHRQLIVELFHYASIYYLNYCCGFARDWNTWNSTTLFSQVAQLKIHQLFGVEWKELQSKELLRNSS